MASASRFTANANVILATVNGVVGYGLIRMAPAGEKWEVDRVFVQCSTRVSEARCIVYMRNVGPQYAADGTYSGSSGDTTDTRFYLEDGEPLFIEWSGGDNGATATVTISGWKSMPEGGFRAVH